MKTLKEEFIDYFKKNENNVFYFFEDNNIKIKNNDIYEWIFNLDVDFNDNLNLIPSEECGNNYLNEELEEYNKLLPIINNFKLIIKLNEKLPEKNNSIKKGKI